jgi:hypothetical protein
MSCIVKARVKSTGVLIDVTPKCNVNAQHSADNLYVYNNMVFRECELDFLNVENSIIDWEQRRYEIVKAAMQGMMTTMPDDSFCHVQAKECVCIANELIKQLKEE